MSTRLANPLGAHRVVSDYRIPVVDGELITPECEVVEYRANEAIEKGDCLMFVKPSATVPVSVAEMTAAAANYLFAGVAFQACASGGICQVVIEGHCLVNVGAGTAAAESYVISAATTTGVFDVDDAPDDGDHVVGIFWGAKNSDNLAFAFISRGGIAPVFEAGP